MAGRDVGTDNRAFATSRTTYASRLEIQTVEPPTALLLSKAETYFWHTECASVVGIGKQVFNPEGQKATVCLVKRAAPYHGEIGI